MPVCIECKTKRDFKTTKALILHLKISHNYNILSVYRCGENDCFRKFNSIKAFVRHVEEHVKNSNFLTDNECQPEPDENVLNLESNSFDYDLDIDNAENIEDDEDTFPSTVSFQDRLKNESDVFVSKFYSKAVLPRNVVQDLIDDTSNFLSHGCTNILKQKVLTTLKSSNADPSDVDEISEMFNALESPFSHLDTEYKRFQYFMATGNFISANEFEIGKQLTQVKTDSGTIHKWVKVTAQHIPLAPVLTKFLELPDSLSSILTYVDYLNENTENLCNYIQTDAWKKKRSKFKSSDIVLPLFVYYDDFEPNNPVGHHCSKVGGIYVTIACLPPEIASRVENIFLSILFNTKDRDDFPVKDIIAPLLEDLRSLEKNGILVKLSTGEEIRIYFVLGLVLGDNLGIHQLCGLVCNFSTANYRCRYCKIYKNQLINDLQIDETIFRNRTNYEIDVLRNSTEDTGITSRCALNELESFHITENL
ncbi:uncharacterized protein LOC127279929 [Leptopilina boulardi]|uniref:uncharacterized protein LOC127279929 n=1 Tax=Leptopilina boulardi TaxID=63433 RepID=UPI0021F52A48|nr:uncharacterized protein LOC127279929 [Leptopilina boulardi]